MTDDSVLIVGRRPRGRPRADPATTALSTRVAVRYHDAIIQQARDEGKSVAGVVRELIVKNYGTAQNG